MKSKHLLLTLLIALLVPWAANAQSTLTVHDGTATSNYVPIYGNWADAYLKCEYIMPAAELADMNEENILDMTWYLSSPASAAWTGTFQIFMKEVEETEISAFQGTEGATVVYEGTLDGTSSTLLVEFTNPYAYNGGNLLIGVYQTAKGNYKSCTFSGETVEGACVQGYNSSSLDGVTATQRNFIPKTTFSYGAPPTCFKPQNLQATLTPGNGTVATLTWERNANGTEDAWVLEYGTASDFTGATSVNVTGGTPSKDLTGLTAETTYYARVKPDCDTEGTKWSDAISFTPTNVYSITVNDGTSTNGYIPIYGYYVDASIVSQFIMPAESLTAMQWGTINKLTFYAAADKDWGAAQFEVYMTEVDYTTFSSTTLVDWTTMNKVMNAASLGISGKQMVVTLDAPYQYTGGNLLIGIKQTVSGDYSSCSWYGVTANGASLGGNNSGSQQNFLPKTTFAYTPGEEPDCLKPTGLAVNYTGGLTAEVSWTSDATAWNIDVNGTVTAITENPYTLTGLTLATTYEVKVQADCSNSQSDWTNAVSFTTDLCLPENQCELTFELTDSYGDGWNGAYIAVVDVLTGASLGQMANQNLDGTTGEETQTVTLTVCDGREIQFVWHTGSFDSEASYVVTDINGEEIFSGSGAMSTPVNYTVNCTVVNCKRPTNVAASNVTNHSATLTWTAGNEEQTAWQIAYSTDADFDPNDITELIDVTEATYTFNQTLAAATTYYVYVRGNCGDETSNWSMNVCSFTTGEAAPAPGSFTASNPTSQSIDLVWTAGGGDFETSWELYYVASETAPDAPTTETEATKTVSTLPTAEAPYTLDGLEAETQYYIWVRANHGNDGYSAWKALTGSSFTTIAACSAMDPVVSNIGHYTATVSWNGESNDGFTVKYRVPASLALDGLSEDFEDGAMPTGWTIEGPGSWTVGTGDYSATTGAHGGIYNAKITHSNTGNETYLVTPNLDLSGQSGLNVNLWYINRAWSGDIDGFGVYYRINGGEWNEIFATTEAHSTWTELNEELPAGAYAANVQFGFKMTDGYGYGVAIDDITIGTPSVIPAGAWQTTTATASPANIEGLEAGTKYDLTVVPNCDETLASDIIQFTTVSENEKYFLGTESSEWLEAGNWEPTGAPSIAQNVELRANATITGDAEANKITTGNFTLTIEDGGKLMTNNSVTATVKKHITGYENYTGDKIGGYYLIANPIHTSLSTTSTPTIGSTGLLTDNYDLYSWDYQQDDEWLNYKTSAFSFSTGLYGYLYANENDVDLTFTGTVRANNSSVSRYLSATTSTTYDWPAWHLIGNPFVCDAYLVNASTTALAYYKMKAAGDEFEAIATAEAIAPMEGIFYQYQAETSGYVYFVRELPVASVNPGTLNINLAQAVTNRGEKGATDNAIIRFGEGNTLEKFSFRENSTKVYIPMDNKDYAVVNAGNVGEMPVSFKAEHNGSYTLSFNAQEVSFSYLHLIDNMTGNDVDLLANPSYSFNAQTTDYASRFRLVFATGSSADGDSFGFINGMGNLCIFGIEGTATVQVVDVLGHVISSDTFSGSYERKLNAAPGVYMVRLIQGNDVKVQKMIVR